MRFGKIPTRLLFACASARTFTSKWDDMADPIVADKQVIPCFVADADSADHVASAVKWATNQNFLLRRDNSLPIEQHEEANTPRKLWVCGLEKRQEGGRAFKVVDEHNHLMDLREDVLLDCLHDSGVQAGGQINGEFVFARVQSQMRLVRVGSKLHAAMVESETRRVSKNLPVDSLIVGGLYANRRGLFVYLGQIDTVEDVLVHKSGWEPQSVDARSEFKSLKTALGDGAAYIKRYHVSGQHLTATLAKYETKQVDYYVPRLKSMPLHANSFALSRSVSAVELVRKFDLDTILADIKAASLADLQSRLVTDSTKMPHWDEAYLELTRAQNLCWQSAGINILRHGDGSKMATEYADQFAQWVKFPVK